MGLYFSIVSIVLLGLVAGLLLALWVQLRGWKEAGNTAPFLAETLANQLLAARNGLADLKKALVTNGPELERLLTETAKARVELQFLLQQVDRVGMRSETHYPTPVATPVAANVAEHVAGVNGMATDQGRMVADTMAEGDPLETLLAGLNAASETPLETPMKRGRVGPITQAELDLQEQVRRTAAPKKVAA